MTFMGPKRNPHILYGPLIALNIKAFICFRNTVLAIVVQNSGIGDPNGPSWSADRTIMVPRINAHGPKNGPSNSRFIGPFMRYLDMALKMF